MTGGVGGSQLELAVEVPGMSVPHTGWEEVGTNPLACAWTIQVHCLDGSCPKIVE